MLGNSISIDACFLVIDKKDSRCEAFLMSISRKTSVFFALKGKCQSAILPIGRTDKRVTFLCLGKEK